MKKQRYLPQIGGVMVSRHNMVSPQNDDTRGGPPPLATPLLQVPMTLVSYSSIRITRYGPFNDY